MLHVGNPSVALPKSVMVVRWVVFGLVVLATTTSSTTTTRMLSIGRNVLVSGFRPLPKSARRRTTPRTGTAANTSMGTTNRRQTNTHHPRRHLGFTASASTSSPGTSPSRRRRTGVVVQNVYDDWRKCLGVPVLVMAVYWRTEHQITITEYDYDYDGNRQQRIGIRNKKRRKFLSLW